MLRHVVVGPCSGGICNTPSPRARSVSIFFLSSAAKQTDFYLKIDHFSGLKPYIRFL